MSGNIFSAYLFCLAEHLIQGFTYCVSNRQEAPRGPQWERGRTAVPPEDATGLATPARSVGWHRAAPLAPRAPGTPRHPPRGARANPPAPAALITAMHWEGLLKASYDLSVEGNLQKQKKNSR